MKKAHEEQIMLESLSAAGCEVTDSVKGAVASGLRAIRRERHEEHVAKNAAYKQQQTHYRKMKMSKDAKTLKAIRDILNPPTTSA